MGGGGGWAGVLLDSVALQGLWWARCGGTRCLNEHSWKRRVGMAVGPLADGAGGE